MDHRLARHDFLPGTDHSAWTLYLFLITVADVQGLSYYSDPALCRHLKMDAVQQYRPAALAPGCVAHS